jgi:catechol 2,3-dioxygenase-like lactoylglutathione lyase family enzyme
MRKRNDGFRWLLKAVGWIRRVQSVAAVLAVCFAFATCAQAGVNAVGVIGLTVGNLNRELDFYTNTLPFKLVSISEIQGKEQDALFARKHDRLHEATLKLGNEEIALVEHAGTRGKPIPEDSRSYDHWFQHIAIVVSDMDAAYARLRAHGVKHVSTAPQTLPEWNKNAAGIKAFYFRDPEDHVLEIIYFPTGKGDPKWQGAPQELFLGIDHTAIVVSDTEKSLKFYRDTLGLRVVGESENYGVEQEHLNQVFGARLRITSLRAAHGPGVEFLEYITPPGGRDLPVASKVNDLVFWNTHLVTKDLDVLAQDLRLRGATFVSRRGVSSQIVRDPDGHALQLDPEIFPSHSPRN